MRRTGPSGNRLRGVWRTVPLSWLAIPGLPAVSAITGKALSPIGSFTLRRSRTPVASSSTVSRAIAMVEVGPSVAGWFSGTVDRRCFPNRGGHHRRFRCLRVRCLRGQVWGSCHFRLNARDDFISSFGRFFSEFGRYVLLRRWFV